jgi:antitoxin CptB
MADASAAADSLDIRRKRLRFRAWHRGLRETDLILGPFADAELPALTADDLDAFERLLDIPDRDILGWVTRQQPLPDDPNRPLIDRIIAFHRT